MTKKREIYRCAVCGNVTEVMNEGHGTLVCCGRPMELMVGNTTDASQEKHVPVVEKVEGGYLVKVGDQHGIGLRSRLTQKVQDCRRVIRRGQFNLDLICHYATTS